MKKVLLLLVFGLVCLGLVASPASALVCNGSGQFFYSYASTASPGTAYYVIGGWPFTNYFYLVSTGNSVIMGQMNACFARSGHVVMTTSNSSACNKATTGINNWGTLTKVTINPIY